MEYAVNHKTCLGTRMFFYLEIITDKLLNATNLELYNIFPRFPENKIKTKKILNT